MTALDLGWTKRPFSSTAQIGFRSANNSRPPCALRLHAQIPTRGQMTLTAALHRGGRSRSDGGSVVFITEIAGLGPANLSAVSNRGVAAVVVVVVPGGGSQWLRRDAVCVCVWGGFVCLTHVPIWHRIWHRKESGLSVVRRDAVCVRVCGACVRVRVCVFVCECVCAECVRLIAGSHSTRHAS